ncbi:MAG: tellurite resistance TerB family protein [Candidatus Omnitrophica bacterium]|nr:hypothetical protein [bacterium]NUN96278.1 tellurite resistance TerB family protein [Candidatus Omnitrophota bacterium]
MIDPERLLGGLLTTGLEKGFKKGAKSAKKLMKGQGVLGGLAHPQKAAIGMGLLGLAFAAYEHFQQNRGSGAGPVSDQGSTAYAGPPPPPPSTPPPPPPQGPMPQGGPPDNRASAAMLLVRAMIAAANADHDISAEERQAILGRARECGLTEEELGAIHAELDHPLSMAEIASRATTPELAEQVYAVSLVAIEVDSEAERNYLKALAKRLGLSEERVGRWERQFAP